MKMDTILFIWALLYQLPKGFAMTVLIPLIHLLGN